MKHRRTDRGEEVASVIQAFEKVSLRRYLRKDMKDVRGCEPWGQLRKSVRKGREHPGPAWCILREQEGGVLGAEGSTEKSARSLTRGVSVSDQDAGFSSK